MGYDVHITRKQNWWDKNGPEIPLNDWIAIVEAETDMRPEGHAEVQPGGGRVVKYSNAGLAVWTAYSRHREGVWFDLRRGNVVVKNPDQEILRKMWSLAKILSARVQGDEGEFYDATGNQI